MSDSSINRALVITLLAVAISRTLISFYSLMNVLWHCYAFLTINKGDNMTIGIKKPGMALSALIFVAAIAISASAYVGTAATPGPVDQQILQARYDITSANVGFVTGAMADVASLVPQASNLQAPAARLNSDLGTLQGYVTSVDDSGFNSYIQNTIIPDTQAAEAAISADRQQWKSWNVSTATVLQLAKDYQSLAATHTSQVNSAWVALGNAKLDYYNDVMSDNDVIIANMSAKGLDVSGMQAAETNAKTNVINPLQAAVSSGNGDTIKQQLASKCLADGTPYSDHFFAADDLARLSSISAKISSVGNLNSTVQQQLASVNSDLSAAGSALQAVGTNPYTGSQNGDVWNNLAAASSELKTILGELNGSSSTQG
jgi:hypothetical protein